MRALPSRALNVGIDWPGRNAVEIMFYIIMILSLILIFGMGVVAVLKGWVWGKGYSWSNMVTAIKL
jgi:hypothetical protein